MVSILIKIKDKYPNHWELGTQVLRFGIIGLLATFVHSMCFSYLVKIAQIIPWAANLWGFSIAFFVSAVGHYFWTFRSSKKFVISLLHFLPIQIFGLSINALAVYIIVDLLFLDAMWCLFPFIFVTPVATFILSKLWAFRG